MLRGVLTLPWLITLGLVIAASRDAAADPPTVTLVLDSGGHTALVNQVEWSRDGKLLVSVSNDKTIRLWDMITGESVRVLRLPIGAGPAGMLNAVSLAPDGSLLAAAGYEREGQDHGIFLVSLPAGEVRQVLRGHTNIVLDLQFSRDGQSLLSSSADHTARVWDVSAGPRQAVSQVLKGHTAPVYSAAWAPDGRRIATGSLDGTARIWMRADATTQHILRGHEGPVASVAWSPDGRLIATGGVDQRVKIWNPAGRLERQFDKLGNAVTSVDFAFDSQSLLITTGGQSEVDVGLLIDLRTNRERVRFRQHDNSILHGALSPDGRFAATAGGNNRPILIWRTNDGSLVHRLEGGGRTPWSIGWGPDDVTLAWGNTSHEASVNNRGPIEQAFEWERLGIVAASTDLQRAQVKRGAVTLEQQDDRTVLYRRDGKIQHAFKLTRANEIVRCYTLMADHLVAIGGDYGISLFSPLTGGLVRELNGHQGSVWALAPSRSGRYIASAADDQTLCVWGLDRDEPIVTFFSARGEWIAWTPDGSYAASPGGERLMGWQTNQGREALAAFYPAAQFRASLYQPDRIRQIVTAPDSVPVAAVPSVDIARVLPPRVAIISPVTGLQSPQNSIEVKATASSVGDHPVTALRLMMNGRPYQGRNGIVTFAKPRPGDVSGSWQIELDPGRHRLTVLADSAVSQGSSAPVDVLFAGQAEEPVRLPKLYVVAVGITTYPGNLRLNYAARDAAALSAALKQHAEPLFRGIEIQQVTDDQATRAAILKGLTWLRSQMTQSDYGIFFFAGHGALDQDGALYFLPVDADAEDLLSSAVPAEQVQRALSGIPGKLITMLDACHAAGFAGGATGKRRGDLSLTDDLVRDLITDESGIIAMCSSTGREFSLENNEHQHGNFTLALIEGLSGKADFNGDDVVYLNELDTYVTDRVKTLTRGQQHPVTAKPGTVRSFPLAKFSRP